MPKKSLTIKKKRKYTKRAKFWKKHEPKYTLHATATPWPEGMGKTIRNVRSEKEMVEQFLIKKRDDFQKKIDTINELLEIISHL